MRNVKVLNGVLWGFNGLLGAGILAFSFVYLLFPQDARSYLAGFEPSSDARQTQRASQQLSDAPLRTLPNPIEKRKEIIQGSADFKAVLKGTMPGNDAKEGAAFIRSQARNTEMVAFVGEKIMFDGKDYDEFAGWKLAEVTKDKAVFTNGAKTAELRLEQGKIGSPAAGAAPGAVGPGVKVNRVGQAYDPKAFKSQLLASSDNRQVWGLDLQEIDWAIQNAEGIVDNDVQVTPYATGGLRVENLRGGSFAAERGLASGDIIRDVNGRALTSIADIKTMLNDPTFKNQNTLRITVERAGKPVSLEYRPLSR